jgi:pimeloyl-ACP methyl ester carboxylesterase
MSGGPRPRLASAWRSKPSTYVVCTLDRAIPLEHQRRMAARASERVEWQTGHSPFLSRPDLVADLLIRLAA